MTRAAAIGECMVELTHRDDATLVLGYAGDTFNTAVYLARCTQGQDVRVDYVTRVGDDWYSDQLLARLKAEGLGTALVQRVPGRAPGLYLIRTDPAGERFFTYYRSESPARGLFGPEHPADVDAHLASYDLVYLSAITLQLLTPAARQRLWHLLATVREHGGRVVFDSNYRPAGWPSPDVAHAAVERTLRLTDIALPTLGDEQALFGDTDEDAVAERLAALGVKEVVVKNGPHGCLVLTGGAKLQVPAERVEQVVDTTAAGDSFNAGYLVARLRGARADQAARAGHRLAAAIIRHPGAIPPAAVLPGPEEQDPAGGAGQA
jgi:2-dehydro-3-deoxygluconokinase